MAKTFEAMQQSAQSSSYDWDYLDLQNRKQAAEIYNKIADFHQKNRARVFSFTSCRQKEGVSTILLNLTYHIRRLNIGKRLLLIDANFQSPSLHSMFRVKNESGLSDILEGTTSVSEAMQQLADGNICVIPSGKSHHNLTGRIECERLEQVLSSAKDQFDFIFVDASPVLTSPDFYCAAETADIVFLVIRSLKVQREAALKAKALLTDSNCTIGGVILNRVQQVIPEWLYRMI